MVKKKQFCMRCAVVDHWRRRTTRSDERGDRNKHVETQSVPVIIAIIIH